MSFNKELNAFQTIENRKRYADTLGDVGVMYRHVGQFDKAVEYLNKQLDIAEKEKQKIQTARALGNKGWVYEGNDGF